VFPEARVSVSPCRLAELGLVTEALQKDAVASFWREVDHRKSMGDDGPLPPVYFLVVPGGGDNGAFGAGLLVGWTKTGDRPDFKLVTGVSTGALIAPFAFLGPGYDARLEHLYTELSPEDIVKPRSILAALTSGILMRLVFNRGTRARGPNSGGTQMATIRGIQCNLLCGAGVYLAVVSGALGQVPYYDELAAAIRSAEFPCAHVIEVFAAGENAWQVQCNSGQFLVVQDKEGNYSVSQSD
jgi:hypothetical protein